jgi:hypothetical protein
MSFEVKGLVDDCIAKEAFAKAVEWQVVSGIQRSFDQRW